MASNYIIHRIRSETVGSIITNSCFSYLGCGNRVLIYTLNMWFFFFIEAMLIWEHKIIEKTRLF